MENIPLPGLKVLGHVDLSQFEKKRKPEQQRNNKEILDLLDTAITHTVVNIKDRLETYKSVPNNIIDNDGKINIESFEGIYSKEEIQHDHEVMQIKKKGFYRTYDSSLQERYNTQDQDALVILIENETKERMRDGNISEDVLFILMNKMVGEDYILVKSSEYDDFENGTDMLLMDSQNGDVICAFDATVEGYNSHMVNKIDRAKKRLSDGVGMRMKYGMRFTHNESVDVALGKINRIPPAIMNIERDKLHKYMQTSDFNAGSPVTELERDIMHDLVNSLKSQINELSQYSGSNISYNAVERFANYIKQKHVNYNK